MGDKYPRIIVDEDRNSNIGHGNIQLTVEQYYDLMHHSHVGISNGEMDDLTNRMLALEADTGAYAAQANGKSFEDALDALSDVCENGGELNLIKDEAEGLSVIHPLTVGAGATTTLNLADKATDDKPLEFKADAGVKNPYHGIDVEGTAVVNGGTVKSEIDTAYPYYGAFAVDGGDLTLNGVKLSTTAEPAIAIRGNGGNLVLTDDQKSEITCDNNDVISKSGTGTASLALTGKITAKGKDRACVYVAGGTSYVTIDAKTTMKSEAGTVLNLQGGGVDVTIGALTDTEEKPTLEGKTAAIQLRGGKLVINSGDIKATGDWADTVPPKSDKGGNKSTRYPLNGSALFVNANKLCIVELNGGEYTSTNGYALYITDPSKDDVKLSITGGKYIGAKEDADLYVPEGVTKFISGGEFTHRPKTEWLAPGYTITHDDELYVVESME